MEKEKKGGTKTVLGHYLLFLVVGIIIFGVGLSVGWEMHKSVQGEALSQFRIILEEVRGLKNKVSK